MSADLLDRHDWGVELQIAIDGQVYIERYATRELAMAESTQRRLKLEAAGWTR